MAAHDDTEERRRADAEFRLHMHTHVDQLQRDVSMLGERVDEIERRQEAQHRENSAHLQRINAALFDESGRSRMKEALDILTTLRMNGKVIAWVAIVAGGLGSAFVSLWNHFIRAAP